MSRGLERYPARRAPVRRRKVQRPRRPRGGISSGMGMIALFAVIAGAAAFGAVFIDWSKLTFGASPMTADDVKAVIMKLVHKAPPDSPEQLNRKAGTIKLLGAVKGGTQVQLGDVRLRLQAPKGHCFLDGSQAGDARVIGVLQKIYNGEIHVLAGFADCSELDAWRTGSLNTLGHYGDFMVLTGLLDKTVKGPAKPLMDVACNTMREYNGEFRGMREKGLKQRFEQAIENAKPNMVRLVGVIDRDANACYFSALQKIMTENGETKVQVNVVAMALVGGKMLYTDLYSVLESDTTMLELLAHQKANIARNIAANST